MKEIVKPLEFSYDDKIIHFLMNDDNVMVNATEMANVFGKRVDVFLKTDHAKIFIERLLSTPNGVDKNKEEVIFSNKKGGTYMNRLLALKFAAWHDVDFEIWIYSTIEKIIFGYYKEHWIAHQKQEKAKMKMEEYKRKLILNASEENVINYFEAQEDYQNAKSMKQRAMLNQYKLLL
jgi:hypothetical protein